MLRTVGDQATLWESLLPVQALGLTQSLLAVQLPLHALSAQT